MNLLLDTHILLWWATDDPCLPEACRTLLEDPSHLVYFSSIAIWEVAIKHSKGMLKMPPDVLLEASLQAGLAQFGFTAQHAAGVGKLPPIHHDPFDRAMIAQAISEPFIFVTMDCLIRRYPVLVQPLET